MSAIKLAALALMVAGALGLIYGAFSYTSDTHTAKMGPLEMTVKERRTVNIPVWAGAGALLVGGLLLVVPGRKS
jgi:TRAP-type C4-dicarboxylate transport system permease small subunit